ncbi:hypothetical protein PI125_g7529 [Phytophthora idaei]|nr:hypothetical protein PI125_g7529 [Phytophthora idaei]
MRRSLLDWEDKTLVQLAHQFEREGLRITWRYVARRMAKSKRTGRELHLRLASLKRTYGKQLANFPPCFFGGSSPASPRFFERGRSVGRRQGQNITKLGGAGSRGGGDSCGIGREKDSHGGTGLINTDHVGHSHGMDRLGVVGPGNGGRRGELLKRGYATKHIGGGSDHTVAGERGGAGGDDTAPGCSPSTVVMLVVLVRINKASAALTTTEIVIAKFASVALIKVKLSPSEVARWCWARLCWARPTRRRWRRTWRHWAI